MKRKNVVVSRRFKFKPQRTHKMYNCKWEAHSACISIRPAAAISSVLRASNFKRLDSGAEIQIETALPSTQTHNDMMPESCRGTTTHPDIKQVQRQSFSSVSLRKRNRLNDYFRNPNPESTLDICSSGHRMSTPRLCPSSP